MLHQLLLTSLRGEPNSQEVLLIFADIQPMSRRIVTTFLRVQQNSKDTLVILAGDHPISHRIASPFVLFQGGLKTRVDIPCRTGAQQGGSNLYSHFMIPRNAPGVIPWAALKRR